MRRFVLTLGAALALAACDGPLPVAETAAVPAPAKAASAGTQTVTLRSLFRSGNATSEIAGARCTLTQAGRKIVVTTPAQVTVALSDAGPITAACEAEIGAQTQEGRATLAPYDPLKAARAGVAYPTAFLVFFK